MQFVFVDIGLWPKAIQIFCLCSWQEPKVLTQTSISVRTCVTCLLWDLIVSTHELCKALARISVQMFQFSPCIMSCVCAQSVGHWKCVLRKKETHNPVLAFTHVHKCFSRQASYKHFELQFSGESTMVRNFNNNNNKNNVTVMLQGKLSRYTPWRRLGGGGIAPAHS
jgi:hypothetical protein